MIFYYEILDKKTLVKWGMWATELSSDVVKCLDTIGCKVTHRSSQPVEDSYFRPLDGSNFSSILDIIVKYREQHIKNFEKENLIE